MHWHLHNYIMSRIPSDLYLIRNPSLGIEVDSTTGFKSVIAKKSKRLMNANKFGLAHHEPPDTNSNIATAETGSIEVTDDF